MSALISCIARETHESFIFSTLVKFVKEYGINRKKGLLSLLYNRPFVENYSLGWR